MTEFIPVSEPLLSGNEGKYLEECLATGWISSEGPFVREFEERFAERIGRKYGIAVLAVRRGRSYILNPSKDEEIKPGDLLIVAGRNEQIGRLHSLARQLSPMAAD